MKKKRYCEVCGKNMGYVNYRYIDSLKVCSECYNHFGIKNMTVEERKKLRMEIRAYMEERTEYLKKLTPEELLATIGDVENEKK